MLVGWFLTRGDDRGVPEERPFVARLDRDPAQRGGPASPDFRLRIEIGRRCWLFAIAVEEDGSVRALYPLVDDRGVIDFGVRGPFEAGTTFLFPPEDREGLPAAQFRATTSLLIGQSDEEPTEENLRAWVRRAGDAASGSAGPDAAEAAARALESDFQQLVRMRAAESGGND